MHNIHGFIIIMFQRCPLPRVHIRCFLWIGNETINSIVEVIPYSFF